MKKQKTLLGGGVWTQKKTLDTWAERAEQRRQKRHAAQAPAPEEEFKLEPLDFSLPDASSWLDDTGFFNEMPLSPLDINALRLGVGGFTVVPPTFPITSVPVERVEGMSVALASASTPSNCIQPVPMPIQPPVFVPVTDDAPTTDCAEITFSIDPEKKASMIVGVTDLMIRLFEERIDGQPMDRVPTPLLAAIASAVFHSNVNFAEHRMAGEQCRDELLDRFASGAETLNTDLGAIKRTRGTRDHDLWALFHCFSRCAQCNKHTTLCAPPKSNNGNVRTVEFYTRRCGCALRYCPSCVQTYYVDKDNTGSVKDIICWMCDDNQEYGFDHWVVKVPIGNVPEENDETRQHAGCLFEPCNECRGNKRHAEAYHPEETSRNLQLFRHRLQAARRGSPCAFETNTTCCSFCGNGHSQGRYWTFDGCQCKGVSTRPTYHMKCARTLATSFESTCAVCGHNGFYRFNDKV